MKIAFLFPGQGSQYVGMGKDFYDAYPEAKKVFDEADDVLKFSLSKLCFEGPFEELTKTQNCQPAVVATSLACLAVLRKVRPDGQPAYVAGLSLGEYSALAAAGVLSFADAVHLVRQRGAFMEEAAARNPGKMYCILGLEPDAIADICRDTACEIANLNCPGQVVISGAVESLEAAGKKAMEKGAKRVIPLDVSGAFHSSRMDTACLKLEEEIEKIAFRRPSFPIVCNVNAREETDPEAIKTNLIRQVNSATYWEASMRHLIDKGATIFFEIGPGSVLKGLFKKIDPMAQVHNIGSISDVEGVAKVPVG